MKAAISFEVFFDRAESVVACGISIVEEDCERVEGGKVAAKVQSERQELRSVACFPRAVRGQL